MGLKNYKRVEAKHFILTGNVMELNFYLQDILNRNPGFELDKFVVINAARKEMYSLDDKLSVLYLLLKRNQDFVGPVEEEKSEEVLVSKTIETVTPPEELVKEKKKKDA